MRRRLVLLNIHLGIVQCSDVLFPAKGHEAYPARFDVDRETQMLGSVKPYRRQVLHLSCTRLGLTHRYCRRWSFPQGKSIGTVKLPTPKALSPTTLHKFSTNTIIPSALRKLSSDLHRRTLMSPDDPLSKYPSPIPIPPFPDLHRRKPK